MDVRALSIAVSTALVVISPAAASPVGDIEQCLGATPTIAGTPEDDVLRGTAGRDVIAGFGGDDVLVGRGERDILCAGTGDDVLKGGRGDDGLITYSGRDHARGGAGSDFISEVSEAFSADFIGVQMQDDSRDFMHGGDGIDYLTPEGGDDVLAGGRDVDIVEMTWVFDETNVDLEAGVAESTNGGTEKLVSIEGVIGGFENDILAGSESSDWMWGLQGADHIDGRGGSDLLWASLDGARLIGGNDQTPDFVASGWTEPTAIDLERGSMYSLEVTHAHTPDVLVGFENAIGSEESDVIIGSIFDNWLYGRGGDDRIVAGAGDDVVFGDGPVDLPFLPQWATGRGADTIDGGLGDDRLDGGAKDDACVNGEKNTSCEADRLDRTTVPTREPSIVWPGNGPAPWWWLRVGQLALHTH